MNAELKVEKLFRIEKDLLGTREVAQQHYFGIQTLRAVENFQLSNAKVADYANFIKALAMVKQACAVANFKLKQLDETQYQAIVFACQEVIAGKYHDQFPVDMLQGGAGTSTNMNANEVICNIALEYLGYDKGAYHILHPNNHVNMSQSTNDVYPTAIRLAVLLDLIPLKNHYKTLVAALRTKAVQFKDVMKMGRTQLQDAVPMTLGQEFNAFATTLEKDVRLLDQLLPDGLYYMNLGGTAIGTGINAPAHYTELSIQALAEISKMPIKSAPDLIEATSDMGDFVLLSGALKRTATKLSKIANDLRLLSSGPRAGLQEIQLEARQPGSSIMPGKVNPVIPEAVNISAFQVIGNDLAITFAAEAGQLQLNAMEPLIAFKLFESIDLIGKAMQMFEDKCIATIQANTVQCQNNVERSIGIVTALNPYLGYETTTRIAKVAAETGRGVVELIREEQLLSEEVLAKALSVESMVHQSVDVAV